MIDPNDSPRFTREELEAVEPPDTRPADFDDFWNDTYRRATAGTDGGARDVRMRAIWSPAASIQVHEIDFVSWGGVRIGGWITRPSESRGAVVVGHGYGGRQWFELDLAERGYTAIFPCIRGFHRSAHPDIPWQAAFHVVAGIHDRDRYVIRGSVADTWLAASALLALCPDCCDRLFYLGGSFGGGLGALALPWDHRFRAAVLEVPTFGHHPIRLKIPSTGSAEAVRLHWLRHPEIQSVLAYYDAATAAAQIDIPVLCAPALFDPAVTPPGQFAVANAIRAAELFHHPAGHFEYPELAATQARFRERTLDFLDRH